jgi:hypothetical protein
MPRLPASLLRLYTCLPRLNIDMCIPHYNIPHL